VQDKEKTPVNIREKYATLRRFNLPEITNTSVQDEQIGKLNVQELNQALEKQKAKIAFERSQQSR